MAPSVACGDSSPGAGERNFEVGAATVNGVGGILVAARQPQFSSPGTGEVPAQRAEGVLG